MVKISKKNNDKHFAVMYSFETYYEAVVSAKNKKDAIAKVKEVLGVDIDIQSAIVCKGEEGENA